MLGTGGLGIRAGRVADDLEEVVSNLFPPVRVLVVSIHPLSGIARRGVQARVISSTHLAAWEFDLPEIAVSLPGVGAGQTKAIGIVLGTG
jgi:hypothetical protein